jgi:hypothetical protein
MAEGPDSPNTDTEEPLEPELPPPPAARPVVRLVLKVLSEPAPVTRDAMVQQMQDVYAAAGIDVVVVGNAEMLNLPLLNDLTVGACILGNTTSEQNELFAHRNGAGPKDICVYFVRSMLPPFSGCATRAPITDEFPNGRPSAVIASGASKWTLGHECGHVLGLEHVPPTDRLMIGEGTWNVAPEPPSLIPAEIDTIKASPFAQTL